MATKDISDLQVVQAYAEMQLRRHAPEESGNPIRFADDILASSTGQCPKVCYLAMERASGRDLVDYGVTLRSGWLTDKGKALLDENERNKGDL